MHTRLLSLLLAFGCLAPIALPQSVFAEDEKKEESEEFDTFHIGIRIGAWYRPEIDFNAKVGGVPPLGQQIPFPTSFDAERDLGIHANPKSEFLVDFDESAVLELDAFIHTRFVNVALQWVAPFTYKGQTSLTQQIGFGGVSFPVSQTVNTEFTQSFLGAEVAINIFNNRYFRISPVIGLRALMINWSVQAVLSGGGQSVGAKGTTADIDSPIQNGDDQILPFPEIGAEVAVGYRSLFEVSLKVLGAYVDYFGYKGSWFRAELAATVYPISFVGFQLGYRFNTYDFASRTSNNTERFSINLDYSGVTFALILRI